MNPILVTVEDGLAEVRLNRPDKMNALSGAMYEGLLHAGERLSQDTSIRAVVLSGEGRAFSAGLDTANFSRMAGAEGTSAYPKTEPRTHGKANLGQYVALLWREMPAPVIAAIHGVAFGAGLQLALGADIRYVTEDARLALRETRWGLVPDMAGFGLLRTLARDDLIRELTYTGRIFSGAEAVAYGFATRIEADPRTAALALAREIVDSSPDAIQAAKRLINQSADADEATLLYAESVEQDAIMGQPNQVEAVLASQQRRKPRFSDRTASVW